jgi:hypothetical protein
MRVCLSKNGSSSKMFTRLDDACFCVIKTSPNESLNFEINLSDGCGLICKSDKLCGFPFSRSFSLLHLFVDDISSLFLSSYISDYLSLVLAPSHENGDILNKILSSSSSSYRV